MSRMAKLSTRKIIVVLTTLFVVVAIAGVTFYQHLIDSPGKQIIHKYMADKGIRAFPGTQAYRVVMRQIVWNDFPELTHLSEYIHTQEELDAVRRYAFKYSGYQKRYGKYQEPAIQEAVVPTAISTPVDNPYLKTRIYVGPGCATEHLNRYSLYLLPGWYFKTQGRFSNLYNYNPSQIKFTHGSPINLPPDVIHIELRAIHLSEGQTIQDWVQQRPYSKEWVSFEDNSLVSLAWKNPASEIVHLAIQTSKNNGFILANVKMDSPEFSNALEILGSINFPSKCSRAE